MPPGQSRSGQQGSYSWALLKVSSFTTPVAFTQGLEPWIRALGSFPRDLLLCADQEGISPPPPQALFTMYTYRGEVPSVIHSEHHDLELHRLDLECICSGVLCITQPGSAFSILWGTLGAG